MLLFCAPCSYLVPNRHGTTTSKCGKVCFTIWRNGFVPGWCHGIRNLTTWEEMCRESGWPWILMFSQSFPGKIPQRALEKSGGRPWRESSKITNLWPTRFRMLSGVVARRCFRILPCSGRTISGLALQSIRIAHCWMCCLDCYCLYLYLPHHVFSSVTPVSSLFCMRHWTCQVQWDSRGEYVEYLVRRDLREPSKQETTWECLLRLL